MQRQKVKQWMNAYTHVTQTWKLNRQNYTMKGQSFTNINVNSGRQFELLILMEWIIVELCSC